MYIPIQFAMQRIKEDTLYCARITIGQRAYSARIPGKGALETIADDILRLTVVAQVRNPVYYISEQDDTVNTPELQKATNTLIGLLHDRDRVIRAHNHVRNPLGTSLRVQTLDTPSFPEYH